MERCGPSGQDELDQLLEAETVQQSLSPEQVRLREALGVLRSG